MKNTTSCISDFSTPKFLVADAQHILSKLYNLKNYANKIVKLSGSKFFPQGTQRKKERKKDRTKERN